MYLIYRIVSTYHTIHIRFSREKKLHLETENIWEGTLKFSCTKRRHNIHLTTYDEPRTEKAKNECQLLLDKFCLRLQKFIFEIHLITDKLLLCPIPDVPIVFIHIKNNDEKPDFILRCTKIIHDHPISIFDVINVDYLKVDVFNKAPGVIELWKLLFPKADEIKTLDLCGSSAMFELIREYHLPPNLEIIDIWIPDCLPKVNFFNQSLLKLLPKSGTLNSLQRVNVKVSPDFIKHLDEFKKFMAFLMVLGNRCKMFEIRGCWIHGHEFIDSLIEIVKYWGRTRRDVLWYNLERLSLLSQPPLYLETYIDVPKLINTIKTVRKDIIYRDFYFLQTFTGVPVKHLLKYDDDG